MHKAEFVTKVQDSMKAKGYKISQKEASDAVDTVVENIQKAVVAGEKVTFMGFGSFEKGHVDKRKGHNPQTGKQMTIPAHNVVRFHTGKVLKKAINKQLIKKFTAKIHNLQNSKLKGSIKSSFLLP